MITSAMALRSLKASIRAASATSPNISFKAKLLRPAEPTKGGSWTFLMPPKDTSGKLPTRSMTTVQGLINGHPFRATLEPDGKKSH